MRSPYDTLADRAYWRPGVAQQDPADIAQLFQPCFTATPRTRIATFGGRHGRYWRGLLRARGWTHVDTETPAGPILPSALAQFGYGLYSARTGQIDTVRQMVQLLSEISGDFEPAHPVIRAKGRHFDMQRPDVEPEGLGTAAQVKNARAAHLRRVKRALSECDMVLFSVEQRTAWLHRDSGTVYPGSIDGIERDLKGLELQQHSFDFDDIMSDLTLLRDMLKAYNPQMTLLLELAPTPADCGGTSAHALVEHVGSKALLRAALGAFCAAHEDVDYLPSYELLTGPQALTGDDNRGRGRFFAPDLMNVTPAGRDAVLRCFERGFMGGGAGVRPVPFTEDAEGAEDDGEDDLICEEVLIESRVQSRTQSGKGAAS